MAAAPNLTSDILLNLLKDGVRELGLSCSQDALARLIQYQELLAKWNKAYNLTAVIVPEQMVRLHLLDSLVVSTHLSGFNILDVGTGAGLPGIPLALINPDKEFFLLDSNAKKTRFVQQAKMEIELQNITVVRSRLEEFHSEIKFETIISRAFSDLASFVYGTRHLLQRDGVMVAMKARLSKEEINQIAEFETRVEPVYVPGIDVERNLVLVSATRIK